MKQIVKDLMPLSLHFKPFIVTVAMCLCIGDPTLAASSDWVETEGGRIRLTALGPDASGLIRGVLDIDLLPGWKTYWRDPGDAGVPPSIEIGESLNIDNAKLDFPAPERVDDGYSIWAGYTYPVALPMTLQQRQAGQPSQIEVDVFLGICESICIPFQARFSLNIDPDHEPNSFEIGLVEDAHAQIPEQPGEDFAVTGVALSEDGERLMLSIREPLLYTATDLFISGPAGWYFDIPELAKNSQGTSVFTVVIADHPQGDSLSGQPLRLLVKTDRRSMETKVKVP